MSPNESDPEYNERELAEIEELNRLSSATVEVTQSKFWKRLTVFVAAIIVLSLLLPIVVLVFNGSTTKSNTQNEFVSLSKIPTPDFVLSDTEGNSVKLSTELQNYPVVILVFYRGFF